MFKIICWLLKIYIKDSDNRIVIFQMLQDELYNKKYSQSYKGRVYESFWEFLSGNSYIKGICYHSLTCDQIKIGLIDEFDMYISKFRK